MNKFNTAPTIKILLAELKRIVSSRGVDLDFRTQAFIVNSYGNAPVFCFNDAETIIPLVYDFVNAFIAERPQNYPDFKGYQYNLSMSLDCLKTTRLKDFILDKLEILVTNYIPLDIKLAGFSSDGDVITNQTISVGFDGEYATEVIEIQTTCGEYIGSLGCMVTVNGEQDGDLDHLDDTGALLDSIISEAERFLIIEIKRRFKKPKQKMLQDIRGYEILKDIDDDVFIALKHNDRWLNSDASPYEIPYKVQEIGTLDDAKWNVKEDVLDNLFYES